MTNASGRLLTLVESKITEIRAAASERKAEVAANSKN
jgi:hypothetical protein